MMVTEESYDVLDEHGRKTGRVLTKSQVHEQELWHASVFIWIYNSKGEILLQRRAKNKKSFPDKWDVSVAGHISAGDTPELTAVREIEEEIGVVIMPDELTPVGLVSDIVPWLPGKKHPEFCWLYILAKELSLDDLKIQTSELTKLKLMPITDLEKARRDPDTSHYYAARNPQVYDIPLERIKERLNEKDVQQAGQR